MARRTVTIRLDAEVENGERGVWCNRCMLPSVERIPVRAHVEGTSRSSIIGHLVWCHDEATLIPPSDVG